MFMESIALAKKPDFDLLLTQNNHNAHSYVLHKL